MASGIGWTRIPAGARIAVRGDGAGHANAFPGKPFALIVLPLVMVALSMFVPLVTKIDSRR
jgi:hypothetical protein